MRSRLKGPRVAAPSETSNNLALASVCGVLFLTFLDTTIVSVALAGIQTSLSAGVSSLQWVVNAYALVFASLMLAAGFLGDRWGRRRVMLAGLAVFCAGSLLGALAPSTGVLIAARALMGLGAAASEPGTLSMLRHLYPNEARRARALGVWAAVSGVSVALGPVLGGVLVGVGGWRAIFWFNVAAGLVALGLAHRVLPESSDPSIGRFDAPGLVLGAAALVAATFGVIQGESSGYTSPPVLALFAVAAVAAAGFAWVEHRSRAPILDVRHFRQGPFSGAVLVAFAVTFGLYAVFFFIALYLQVVASDSGYRLALQVLPLAVAMVAGSLAAGRWIARRGPGVPMAIGCLVAGAGMLATRGTLVHGGFAALAATLALGGLGVGAALVPVTTVALAEVPAERSGMAASTANTARELGAVCAVAILGALMNAHLTTDLTAHLRAIGIPPNFQGIVISAVEHGGVPGADPQAAASYGPIVNRVIATAYDAFRSGVYEALLIGGGLLVVLSPVSAVLLRGRSGRRRPAR